MPKTKALSKTDGLDAILARTNKENPDPADLKVLREHLDENPDLIALNDPTRRAFAAIRDSYSTTGALTELMKRNFAARRKELDYDASPLIVRLLIDQFLLSEMRLAQFELEHRNKTANQHTLTLGIYYEKRLHMTQRRFLKAAESFAKVKRLLAEVDFYEEKAREKRSQGTLNSRRLYKSLSS